MYDFITKYSKRSVVQGAGELTDSLLLEVHVITGGPSEIKSLYGK